MRALALGLVLFLPAACTQAETPVEPEAVSFASPDGGVVYADRYGEGGHWVVLVHGARFDKGSWEEEARRLAEEGFTALAMDLRGYGRSRAGSASEAPSLLAEGDVRGEGVPRLPDIRDQYERAPGPKELVLLEGSAHAQHLFATDQGERLMAEILRFLSAPTAE